MFYYLFFLNGHIIATPMKIKPRNARVGPTTIRLVEKMSGLNSVVEDGEPVMSRKPTTITSPAIAIRMKLIRFKGRDTYLRSSEEVD